MGVIDVLPGIAMSLLLAVIFLAIAFVVLANFRANATVAADGNATYAIGKFQGAMQQISDNIGLIVFLVVMGLVVAAAVGFIAYSSMRK